MQPQQTPEYTMTATPTDYDDEIDLAQLWHTAFEYKWLIVAISIVFTSVAITYALLSPRIYRAEIVIAPAAEKKAGALSGLANQYGGLAALAGININAGSDTNAQALATLRAKSFTKDFIKDNGLLPILFYKKWDKQQQKWKVDDPEDIPTLNKAYDLFDKKVRSVYEDKKNGMIVLSIEWKDRKLTALWAAELVKRVNSTMRERDIREAQQSLAFLKQELQKTGVVELQQSIYKLIEGQTKTMMLASVQEEYAFKVIDPPSVPDKDDHIKPKRKLIALGGLALGLLTGIALSFLISAIKRPQNGKQ